jgi:hypothetical protein
MLSGKYGRGARMEDYNRMRPFLFLWLGSIAAGIALQIFFIISDGDISRELGKWLGAIAIGGYILMHHLDRLHGEIKRLESEKRERELLLGWK